MLQHHKRERESTNMGSAPICVSEDYIKVIRQRVIYALNKVNGIGKYLLQFLSINKPIIIM